MNTLTIKITGGRLIDPFSGRDEKADLFIAEGKILAIGTPPPDFSAERVIDANQLIICPGLVDLSAHLWGIKSELTAAVAGGVTTLACPPDMKPPLDEPQLVEQLIKESKALGLAHVHPIGALTQGLAGEKISEIASLKKAGCLAFSQASKPLPSAQNLLRAMRYAATFGCTLHIQPQEHSLALEGVMHEGEVATRLGLAGIPICAETIAIGSAIALATETGVRLHLARISSARGMALIEKAARDGLPVSCDVSISHLHFIDRDIGYFDSQMRLTPPLRAEADRAALRRAVLTGFAAIASDHTPLNADAKQHPFAEASAGASTLELLLPLVLRFAHEEKCPLPEALAAVTSRPAKILGLHAGRIAVGEAADLCVFAPEAPWVVSHETIMSRGKNTPLWGETLHGRVKMTLVAGQPVFEAPTPL